MKNEISASIITYNPDIELLRKNILSFIDDVDEVYIIDNFSENAEKLKIFSENLKIKIVFLSENLGIARALNIGLELAEKSNSKYFLSMDQDSFFEKKSVSKLKIAFENINENIAIVCPNMHDLASGYKENSLSQTSFVNTTISSGALCKVDALRNVGAFVDKLFIDAVDFDICLKLLNNNFKILKLNQIYLNHNLGESVIKNFLGKPTLITNHSALRRYYQYRNSLYLFKNYFFSFPFLILRYFLSNLKTIILILLFEKSVLKKIYHILLGLLDGIIGNYGRKK